jgi:hypothetical protein
VAITDDQRWANWCADFDEVEREIFNLFHTRWMWRAITSLMANGVPEKQYVVVQNYFIKTYVTTMCTAIRREADFDARTSSLARCLRALIECPHFMTRTRYVAEAFRDRGDDRGGPNEREVRGGFDQFAPGGAEFVDSAVVQDALDRLTAAAAPVRKYTNKVIAHRDRAKDDVELLTPSWNQINAGLDELGRVTKQFYSLRHPATHLAYLTPIVGLDFVLMFRVAWWSEGWRAPEDHDHL